MNPSDLLLILRTADALLALLGNAGISITKLNNLREQNADGRLTEAQLEQLANDAHAALAQLGRSPR